MDLLLLFTISALFLAGLGVYGVVTYSVVQRQRDLAFGSRSAHKKQTSMPSYCGRVWFRSWLAPLLELEARLDLHAS
jgi:hypothetical protein